MAEETSDFDKLTKAFSTLTSSFSSFDDLLHAFGLKEMPPAQRYGIMFGCLTFFCTVAAVITLLTLGGSFKRIAEQAQTGTNTVPSTVEARAGRPLLLERLLEARERMLENYKQIPQKNHTILETLLMNDAPTGVVNVAELVDESSQKRQAMKKNVSSEFEQNYVVAYRMCQDKPGGRTLSGLPEARFEAYARAYAGCGNWTTTAYRRSYARLYERMACSTHAMEKKYSEHYMKRPQDLIGRTVRLEPLQASRHGQDLYDITCGQAFMDCKSFDPNEVFAFTDFGPFESVDKLKQSWIFKRPHQNEAGFAIIEMMTDRLLGVVHLIHDDPQNLNIQMEPPICKPTSKNTAEELEACFLLMDRLFALGYRRIQLSLDTQDADHKKLPGRLGFTQEGMIPKHLIVKEANRDSNIYGMLNSDWDKGARSLIFKKLHGQKAQKQDELNNKKEGEIEEQQEVLKERQLQEAEEEKENKENKKSKE